MELILSSGTRLIVASQSRTEDLQSGLPHESAIVSGYQNPQLIGANEILPTVDVSRERGSWTEFGADGHQIVAGLEQPLGQGRKDVTINVAHGDYRTVKIGVNARLYDEEINEAEPEDVEAFRDASIERAADALELYKEKAIRDFVSLPANYASGFKESFTTSASRWSDYTNSDPNVDMDRMLTAWESAQPVDRTEATVALAADVFEKVKNHPKCQIITNNLERRPATEQHLAMIWGVKAVKVLRGKYGVQTDPKDPLTATFYYLWTNVVVIYRKIDKPSRTVPLAGAIVRRKGFPKAHEPYRDKDKDCDVYPITDKWGLVWRANSGGQNRMYLAERVVA